jgi:hypothetical protein
MIKGNATTLPFCVTISSHIVSKFSINIVEIDEKGDITLAIFKKIFASSFFTVRFGVRHTQWLPKKGYTGESQRLGFYHCGGDGHSGRTTGID